MQHEYRKKCVGYLRNCQLPRLRRAGIRLWDGKFFVKKVSKYLTGPVRPAIFWTSGSGRRFRRQVAGPIDCEVLLRITLLQHMWRSMHCNKPPVVGSSVSVVGVSGVVFPQG